MIVQQRDAGQRADTAWRAACAREAPLAYFLAAAPTKGEEDVSWGKG